eukprot:15450161-Alexandrium_andersonii.AAC.1
MALHCCDVSPGSFRTVGGISCITATHAESLGESFEDGSALPSIASCPSSAPGSSPFRHFEAVSPSMPQDFLAPVSYTHLTLPTICSV